MVLSMVTVVVLLCILLYVCVVWWVVVPLLDVCALMQCMRLRALVVI